ncbi:MAG: hypothetical protein HY978_02000 [Candidatus Liptonbacteria bacterium]|nr:hypothetical protein [Candidatus Liptonbacteria bacterium]
MNNLANLAEIQDYRLYNPGAQLLLDTNVLLIFLVGIYDEDYLKECPLMTDNNKNYGKEHFDLVQEILKCFIYKIVITPQVLAEIYMLSSKKIKPPSRFNEYFVGLINQLKKCREEHIPLKILLEGNGSVVRFGFTDISLVEAAKKLKSAILTDDFPLYEAFREVVPVIYFSQVCVAGIFDRR